MCNSMLGMVRITPAVRTLMILSGAFFVADLFSRGLVTRWLILGGLPSFSPVAEMARLEIWRVFTYPLVNPNVLDFLINLFLLWIFGASVEGVVGTRRFYLVFAASCLAGGVAATLTSLLGTLGPVAGMTVGVTGITIAFAALFPEAIIMLFLTIPTRARYMAVGIVIVQVAFALATSANLAVAQLGGAACGWLMIRSPGRLDGLLARPLARRKKRRHLRTVPTASVELSPQPLPRPAAKTALEKEVDAILDKIRLHGMNSLSAEERRTLDALSTELRDRDQAR
jgi:membrane associated rhomboid family serine protease